MDPDPFDLVVSGHIMNSLYKKKTHASFISFMPDSIRCRDKLKLTVLFHFFPQLLEMKSSHIDKHDLMLVIRLKFFRYYLIRGSLLILSYPALHTDPAFF